LHITRLRLTGFKSFVEPTELHIEHGLTGVIGPNGGGKSNLLEALRWVMGESSTRNMRAAAMDDVIFGGSQGRPARDHAEVTIVLDNSARTAPAGFNDADSIEITRRIERQAGSSYRLNGREARARDVKILFEDAATGARSPALVRQGQIAELVNAKPEARRRILEDAAGTAGLHSRRHDAELRLKAAETNLARVGDVLGQLASQITTLKRQSRQAQRYKEISTEIIATEAMLLVRAWQSAHADVIVEEAALAAAMRVTASIAEAQSQATRAEAEAALALPAARDIDTGKAAALRRLQAALEALDRDEERTRQRLADVSAALVQAQADAAREQGHGQEASDRLARAREESTALDQDQAHEAVRLTAASQAAEAADAALADAEQTLAALTQQTATALAAARTLVAHEAELDRRDTAISQQIAALDAQARTLQMSADPDAAALLADDLIDMMARVEEAQRESALAETAVVEARHQDRQSSADVAAKRLAAERLRTEMTTLRRVLIAPVTKAGGAPILSELKVAEGYEAALAAALGDDLDAPRGSDAAMRWLLMPKAEDPALPPGAAPLSNFVRAPAELNRRLAQIGLVEPAEAAALQPLLAAGQRLVSRQGDLWRWDGFVQAAGAEAPATARLRQFNRLSQLERRIAASDAELGAAEAASVTAASALTSMLAQEQTARGDLQRCQAQQARLATASAEAERHARELTLRSSSIDAQRQHMLRSADEIVEARAALATERATLADTQDLELTVASARARVSALRPVAAQARAALIGRSQESERRSARRHSLSAEQQRCAARLQQTQAQLAQIAARISALEAEVATLSERPDDLAEQRSELLADIGLAEAARRTAADTLVTLETAIREAQQILRGLGGELLIAREGQARIEVRLDGCRERRNRAAQAIADTHDCNPENCLTRIGLKADQPLPEAVELERRLKRLREDRERLGGVNLAAEHELSELSQQHDGLAAEMADLQAAVDALRQAITRLEREGRKRLAEAFGKVDAHFRALFSTLFGGGEARLELIEDPNDPLAGGLEIIAKPPGKKPATLSLLSGGEQTLTAMSLIFAVFLTNPSPICVLDEVDAPLDDGNVDRFCTLLEEMARKTVTRFLVITHHPMTMSRMDRLFGVTMAEKGVSQLVSVDLTKAEQLREAG
jgi:chromosome segregation protein